MYSKKGALKILKKKGIPGSRILAYLNEKGDVIGETERPKRENALSLKNSVTKSKPGAKKIKGFSAFLVTRVEF